MSVRVRIAPSPTGDPHVGTAYIALFNLIFARHFNGKFILRIEDTDQVRSLKEYEENIYNALSWCNIQWDEGPDIGGPFAPYRQSERKEIYLKHAQILIDKGMAYKCFATPKELEEMREIARASGQRIGYDRRYRNLSKEEIAEKEKDNLPFVIRLKIPLTGECVFDDQGKGKISFPWADIDDQILIKSDGHPTYHLANVVDDKLMEISHVIRGDEWLSSTPKHIFLYEAFGWEPPVFLHMPLLLGKDGKKLSKRKNPTSVFYYRDSGYLPEAMVNFLTLMGYSMPNSEEFYSLEKIIKDFDPKRIGISGAFFDIHKLDWLNQKYIIESIEEKDLWPRLKEWLYNDEFMQKLMPLAHTRIKTFGDFMSLFQHFFINNLPLEEQLLKPKGITNDQSCYLLQSMILLLEPKPKWTKEEFEKTSHEVADIFGVNFKKVMIALLFATLTGKTNGPPLFSSVEILGKDRIRARLLNAIELLGGISNKKMDILKKVLDRKDGKELFQ